MINNLNYKDTLKIGTAHSLYSGYIKHAVKKFMKLNPNTSIEIIINHTHNLLEMLSNGLIDIGFVFTLTKSNKFICSNILKDEIILVTKNSSEFKNEINIEDLKSITLLYADAGDFFIKYVEDQLHSKLDFQLSIDQILEIVEYLREGFGYAFIPKSLVADSIQNGYLKKVKIKNTPSFPLEGYVVFEKSKFKKESVECFIELLTIKNTFSKLEKV